MMGMWLRQIIHYDIMGLFMPSFPDSLRYLETFQDDYSRHLYIDLMNHKWYIPSVYEELLESIADSMVQLKNLAYTRIKLEFSHTSPNTIKKHNRIKGKNKLHLETFLVS